MMSWELNVAGLLDQVPLLKRMNARGNDIFVRPAATESHAIILLDELHNEMLPELREAGFDPAVIIETNPGCYQAWVKLAPHAVSPEVRQEAAQSLAMRFGAVRGGAHSYGRLAGFANRWSWPERDGNYPEVLIHACRGVTAPAGIALIERVQIDLEQHRRMEMILAGNSPAGAAQVTLAYCNEAHGLMAQSGEDADLSLLDLEVSKRLAEAGWRPEQIAGAIIEASPSMGSWNAWRLEDYARCIAENAWSDPEVVARREQRSATAKDQDHDGIR